MFSVLIATCSSDLTVTLRGGPYSVVTQLRDNPSCKSPLPGVHLRKGVILWVPTHAPQPIFSCSGSVYTFFSYHARDSPLGVGTSRVRLLPTGARTPGSHLSLLFITVLRHWGFSRCRPFHGLSYPWVSGGDTVNASSWRCLHLAMPTSWRRLKWSICWLSSLGPLRGPAIRWLLTLTLTLVNVRGRDGTGS